MCGCVDVWICGDGDNCTSIHIYKYIIIYKIILNIIIFEYYKNRQPGVEKKEKVTRDRSNMVYEGVSRRAGGVSGVIGGYRVCRRRRPARAREPLRTLRTLRTGERGGDVSAQVEEAKSSGVGGFYAEA